MNPIQRSSLVLVLLAPVASAQMLQVAGYVNSQSTATTPFGANITEPLAAVRYTEGTNETTLLFVHTTIDVSVAGPRIARGIIETYPFLRSPESTWLGSSITGVPDIEILEPTAQLSIPPERIAHHLAQFLAESGPVPVYGTVHGNAAASTVNFEPLVWPGNLARADERNVWANAEWPTEPSHDLAVFDVSQAGREAATQAAFAYAALVPGMQLDDVALTELGNILDQDLGFEIHVQAVRVEKQAGGPSKIRFSQVAVMRRRSLFETLEDPWRVLMGPRRWVPSLLDHNVLVYFGVRLDQLHVLFPGPVSDLHAWIPTATGLVEAVQLTNPTFSGELLHPEIARFEYPSNGIHGLVYFTHDGSLVECVRSLSGAALVVASNLAENQPPL